MERSKIDVDVCGAGTVIQECSASPLEINPTTRIVPPEKLCWP
jgi:hypothetical protein